MQGRFKNRPRDIRECSLLVIAITVIVPIAAYMFNNKE